MAAFKCKMCGGTLEIEEGKTVCICEYCGTKQTVPNANNEKKINLFNRANRLRFACEFDQAASVYESIVAEFPEEAEAYWGLCLCKYGIEYVDDPKTAKKIPTCHRTCFDSIFDDDNFNLAQEYSDVVSKLMYRAEAKNIDILQKSILEIANKEEPFDIFICYKESDENGERTVDSELAHDLYDVLTEKGYKVFYSRITLKAKLGQDYEPYIFSALNTAKIMLAVGTKYEYYNSVWVKNEWNRYLAFMTKDKEKKLIPCYKDIDAYDIPKEFNRLQGQDLSSPRAFQDLVSNIEKILSPSGSKANEKGVVAQQVNVSGNPTEDSLIQRAFAFLEDGNWDKVYEYCEKVLDINVKNQYAYLCKLCADLKVKTPKNLANESEPFNSNANYKKIIRYGDDTLKKEIQGYIDTINNRIKYEEKQKEKKRKEEEQQKHSKALNYYETAKKDAENPQTLKQLFLALECFSCLGYPNDSKNLAKMCRRKIASAANTVIASMYTIGLKSDGTVVAAGEEYGQWDVSDWTDIVEIAASASPHAVGLKSDGKVVAVGTDSWGICNVSNWTDIVEIAVSENYTVGLKSDGTVLTTGNDDFGHIDVSEWKDVIKISTSDSHIVGLKNDGTVVACGRNTFGECDVSDWTDIIAISIYNSQTVGLKSDGTVVAVGYGTDESLVSNWTDIVAITAGENCIIGLKADGTVETVGIYKSCGVSDWTDIATIVTSGKSIVGLKIDGTVVYYGDDDICDITDWVDIVAISIDEAGYNIVGLKSDGTVVSTVEDYSDDWKDIADPLCMQRKPTKRKQNVEENALINKKATETQYRTASEYLNNPKSAIQLQSAIMYFHSLGERKNLTKLYAVNRLSVLDCSKDRTIAIRSNGTVIQTDTKLVGFGKRHISNWTDIISVAVGHYHTVGLKSNGTVIAIGEWCGHPVFVDNWTEIVAIAAGWTHAVGLKSNGTVFVTDSNNSNRYDVSNWRDIVAVSAGWDCVIGLKSDGTVVATGNNRCQQCNVSNWTDIVAISAGDQHTVGLKSDGTVVVCGINSIKNKICEDVKKWKKIVAIAAGKSGDFTLGLKSDGTVVQSGGWYEDRNFDVSNWKNIVAIAAGNKYAVGIREDGTVVSTGNNENGQCDVYHWNYLMDPLTICQMQENKNEYSQKGLCAYCGGTFKGVFTKKCSKCGREKNY